MSRLKQGSVPGISENEAMELAVTTRKKGHELLYQRVHKRAKTQHPMEASKEQIRLRETYAALGIPSEGLRNDSQSLTKSDIAAGLKLASMQRESCLRVKAITRPLRFSVGKRGLALGVVSVLTMKNTHVMFGVH